MNFKGILLSDRGQSIKNTVKFLLYDTMKKRNSRDSVKRTDRKKEKSTGFQGAQGYGHGRNR